MVLERNGKVWIGLVFGEVDAHAGVDVSVVGSIFFHFVSDVFKGLSHAVLDHFLFGFLAFFELLEQYRNNVQKSFLILEVFKDLFFDLVLVFVQIKD